MKLDINCIIDLPNGKTVAMTPKQFTKFHDDLTSFYNDNFPALNKDEN